MKKYEKPVVVVDNEVSEGVYAASGAAVVTVKLDSKTEFHAGSGAAKFVISWPADVVLRSITLIFNQNIDSAYANTAAAVSGNKVTFAYNGWNSDTELHFLMYINCYLSREDPHFCKW